MNKGRGEEHGNHEPLTIISKRLRLIILLVGRWGIEWHANHINPDTRNVHKLPGRVWQQRGMLSSLLLCDEDYFGSSLGKF